jgi:hypothetical protein
MNSRSAVEVLEARLQNSDQELGIVSFAFGMILL